MKGLSKKKQIIYIYCISIYIYIYRYIDPSIYLSTIYLYIERCIQTYIGPNILNVQKGNVQRSQHWGRQLAVVLGRIPQISKLTTSNPRFNMEVRYLMKAFWFDDGKVSGGSFSSEIEASIETSDKPCAADRTRKMGDRRKMETLHPWKSRRFPTYAVFSHPQKCLVTVVLFNIFK